MNSPSFSQYQLRPFFDRVHAQPEQVISEFTSLTETVIQSQVFKLFAQMLPGAGPAVRPGEPIHAPARHATVRSDPVARDCGHRFVLVEKGEVVTSP